MRYLIKLLRTVYGTSLSFTSLFRRFYIPFSAGISIVASENVVSIDQIIPMNTSIISNQRNSKPLRKVIEALKRQFRQCRVTAR